jgi:hypothetical protein
MDKPWIFGLIIVSGIAGQIFAFTVFRFLVWATGAPAQPINDREWWYTGVLTGIFERCFFTCVIGLIGGSNGAVAGMIGWLAVKAQVHYKIFSENNLQNLPQVYVGLLGSLASLLLAMFGGYLWEHGHTLAHPFVGKTP